MYISGRDHSGVLNGTRRPRTAAAHDSGKWLVLVIVVTIMIALLWLYLSSRTSANPGAPNPKMLPRSSGTSVINIVQTFDMHRSPLGGFL